MSSTGRTTWGRALLPAKQRRRGCRKKQTNNGYNTYCLYIRDIYWCSDPTYRLIHFPVITAFANQVELVLWLFLRRRTGGSVHQRSRTSVGPRHTRLGSPERSCSYGPPRHRSWLKEWSITWCTLLCQKSMSKFTEVFLPWLKQTSPSVFRGRAQTLCSTQPWALRAKK